MESLIGTNLESLDIDNSKIISKDYLDIIIIFICYDNLNSNDLLLLNKFIIKKIKGQEFLYKNDTELLIFNILKKKINDLIIVNGDTQAIIIPNNDAEKTLNNKKYTLYIIKDTNLELAEPIDYEEFDEVINNKFKYSQEIIDYDIYGFVIKNQNNSDYLFKLRKEETKQGKTIRTSGAICYQAGKSNIQDLFLKQILDSTILSNILDSTNISKHKTKLNLTDYCIILELYLRYYNLINKDGKIWFSDNLHTFYNGLNKIRNKKE